MQDNINNVHWIKKINHVFFLSTIKLYIWNSVCLKSQRQLGQLQTKIFPFWETTTRQDIIYVYTFYTYKKKANKKISDSRTEKSSNPRDIGEGGIGGKRFALSHFIHVHSQMIQIARVNSLTRSSIHISPRKRRRKRRRRRRNNNFAV